MENNSNYLPDNVPNFPPKYQNEIPRDSLIRFLSENFNPTCHKQIIVSKKGTGKTNFLGQFCRYYPKRAVSYFIDSNPLSQDIRSFLHVLINQFASILDIPALDSVYSIEELRNVFPHMSVEISKYCQRIGFPIYIVIDGIDHCINDNLEILNSIPLTYNLGPYILLSAQPATIDLLPDCVLSGATIHDNISTNLVFNENDTKFYLDDLSLNTDEISEIHSIAGGLPEYLKYIYEAIKTDGYDWIKLKEIPSNLEQLVQRQIDHFYSNSPDDFQIILDYLAVSPFPVPNPILQEVINNQVSISPDDFTGLGFVTRINDSDSLFITSELAREIVCSRIGDRKSELIDRLIEILMSTNGSYEGFIDILINENSDYKRIVELLDTNVVLEKLSESNNLIGLSNRIHTAYELSVRNNEISEVIRWSRFINILKSLHQHSVESREIKALISIQEFDEALQKIYLIPDALARTRLLGKVYSEMNTNQVFVAAEQIDEIRVLIDTIRLEELDKEVVQELAIDIFEILPDKAIEILERKSSEDDKKNLLDLAISKRGILGDSDDIPNREKIDISSKFGKGKQLSSHWIKNLSFTELIFELEKIEKTRAKEYILRRWCLQNPTNDYLYDAINYWIDIVVSDSDFNVSLRSVLELSDLIKFVEPVRIRGLSSRIDTLLQNSIKAPIEDWYSIQLLLTEALFIVSNEDAIERLLKIYEDININISDKDVLINCYAQVWKTSIAIHDSFEEEVKRNFFRILYVLLEDSANQWEILERSLFIISSISVEEALEIINDINTTSRRYQATTNVIIHGICENPDIKISEKIIETINSLEEVQQFNLLRELLRELYEQDIELISENQKIMLNILRKIDGPHWKAKCIGILAGIWTYDEFIKHDRLVAEVYRYWKEVKDLRTKIFLGFELVEVFSPVDRDLAKDLYKEVQNLLIQPGSSLAVGRLGITYKKSIELSISLLSQSSLGKSQKQLKDIFSFISHLPSTYVRCQLYSQLAARAYTLGNHPIAEKIVNGKILPELNKIYKSPQYWRIHYYTHPVLLKYHKETAEKYIVNVSSSYQDIAWYLALVWQITLGNILLDIEVEKIKNVSTFPIISDLTLFALKRIGTDEIVYSGIIAITKCIEQSIISNDIDATQAFDLLNSLDEVAESKLPDGNNIKHDGYLVVALGRIHATRSFIYNRLQKKGRYSKVDIRKKWSSLFKLTQEINNNADRVFINITLAKYYSQYDKDGAKDYLHRADSELNDIPSIIDRSDRMQLLLEIYGRWGYSEQARYFIQKNEELLEQFEGYSKDQKLERLVQTVYEFDEDLAEDIASRFYKRNPDALYNPIDIKLASKEISNSPKKINEITRKSDIQEIQAMIVQNSIKELIHSQIVNDAVIPSRQVLMDWALISPDYDEKTHYDILHWVSHYLLEKGNKSEIQMLSDHYSNSTIFIDGLSKWTSPSQIAGISKELNQYLPGMEGRIYVFQEGEEVQAKAWVKDWIKENTQKYLKIVDPYFGPSQIEYLSGIPNDCKVLIVTTDIYFQVDDPGKVKQSILDNWQITCKGEIPKIVILVVPKDSEGQFHCRAIATLDAGLNIGQSLNGLGKKTGKLTRLEGKDAKELEDKYINDMLNNNKWFIDYDTQPIIITI